MQRFTSATALRAAGASILALTLATACSRSDRAIHGDDIEPDSPTTKARRPRGLDASPRLVAFGRTSYNVVGHRVAVRQEVVTTLDVSNGIGRLSIRSQKIFELEQKVLEADGTSATKRSIHYTAASETLTKDGRTPPPTQLEIAGKSYEAEMKDGALTLTNDDGTAVSPKVFGLVRSQFLELGKPDVKVATMPASLWPGQDVDVVAKALDRRSAEVFAGRDRSVGERTLTFKGTEETGAIGVFATTSKVSIAEVGAPFVMNFAMAGESRVRTLDAWDVDLDLEGPLTLAPPRAASGGPAWTGTGSLRMRVKQTYP